MRAAGGPFASLALASHAGESSARDALAAALAEHVRRGDDSEIDDALLAMPSPAAYRHLWEAVCAAVERSLASDEAVYVRLFALPLLLVAGSRTAVTLTGVVPDIAEVTNLLAQHGAIGATRDVGMSDALCSLEVIEQLRPGDVYRWSREWLKESAPRDIAPQAIVVAPGREQVHLRFLIGGAVTPAHAPSFLETAAHIGAWGIPVTRALVSQLAQRGVELLPVPRPPVGLLKAAHSGRSAQLDAAFNLFASNAIRNFRASVGDPTVIISAHRLESAGAEIRISMSSAFDDALLDGFRWPLHPLDDLNRIVAMVTDMLNDCRVTDVRVSETIWPERLNTGALFLRAGDAATPGKVH